MSTFVTHRLASVFFLVSLGSPQPLRVDKRRVPCRPLPAQLSTSVLCFMHVASPDDRCYRGKPASMRHDGSLCEVCDTILLSSQLWWDALSADTISLCLFFCLSFVRYCPIIEFVFWCCRVLVPAFFYLVAHFFNFLCIVAPARQQDGSAVDLNFIDDAFKLQTDEAALERGRCAATSSTTPSSC